MIKKKNEKSNLEKKKVLYFEMGITIVLALLLVAFEWGTEEIELPDLAINDTEHIAEEIEMKVTRPDLPKPPPPPPTPISFDVITDPTIDFVEQDFIWDVNIDENEEYVFIEMDEEKAVDDVPFVRVEDMPKYQGNGTVFFQRHLQQLVKYPAIAQENNVSGRVFVEFVVDENGNIIRERIVKSPHPSLSEAVLDAIKKTEQWTPGKQRGRKVKVSFTVPVVFKLS